MKSADLTEEASIMQSMIALLDIDDAADDLDDVLVRMLL